MSEIGLILLGVGLLSISGAIAYLAYVVKESAEEFDNDLICLLAIEKIQLKLALIEAEMEPPEWLDDFVSEEADPQHAGRVLKLVKSGVKFQEKEDEPE